MSVSLLACPAVRIGIDLKSLLARAELNRVLTRSALIPHPRLSRWRLI